MNLIKALVELVYNKTVFTSDYKVSLKLDFSETDTPNYLLDKAMENLIAKRRPDSIIIYIQSINSYDFSNGLYHSDKVKEFEFSIIPKDCDARYPQRPFSFVSTMPIQNVIPYARTFALTELNAHRLVVRGVSELKPIPYEIDSLSDGIPLSEEKECYINTI